MERKSDKSFINKTYVWVAIIIGAAIFGYGLLNFISKENERTNQSEIQRKEQLEKSMNLNKCLDKAQERFMGLLELNSKPNPQPGYPDARTWDSAEISEATTAELEKAKELCAKLYGSK